MGRWVTSGATSINKGVENAQLEPWPPRDRRATGSRINVNSFVVTDGRCACIALVYARDAAFIARLAVYIVSFMKIAPLNHEQPESHRNYCRSRSSLAVSFALSCANTSTSSYPSFVNRIRPIGTISAAGLYFVETNYVVCGSPRSESIWFQWINIHVVVYNIPFLSHVIIYNLYRGFLCSFLN